MHSITDFYRGEAPDMRGRTLDEILDWDYETLEDAHDYIQTLFPLPEPGVAAAPLLDDEVIAAFRADPALRANLRRSLERMLRFYGFRPAADGIVRGEDFEQRAEDWLVIGDHNFLRITRILRCCTLLGLEAEARAFPAALEEVYSGHADTIGERTMAFWRGAAAAS
jgi:hypothetical protein